MSHLTTTETMGTKRYTVRKEMGMWEVLFESRVVRTCFTRAEAELMARVWNSGRSRPTIEEINAILKSGLTTENTEGTEEVSPEVNAWRGISISTEGGK